MWGTTGTIVVAALIIASVYLIVRFYMTRETPRDREIKRNPETRPEARL